MVKIGKLCRKNISIHALREEGDSTRAHTRTRPADFYPRPPRGGRRASRKCENGCLTISIHALREEGDPSAQMGVMR